MTLSDPPKPSCTFRPSRTLVDPPRPLWTHLDPPRSSWSFRDSPGFYQSLPDRTRPSQSLLKLAGHSWTLRNKCTFTWPIQILLDPPRPLHIWQACPDHSGPIEPSRILPDHPGPSQTLRNFPGNLRDPPRSSWTLPSSLIPTFTLLDQCRSAMSVQTLLDTP